jgi:hypothetical protein
LKFFVLFSTSYLINGEYFGSCDYPDLCKALQFYFSNAFDETCSHYEWLTGNDNACNCPFNIGEGVVDLTGIHFDIPDFTMTTFSFLSNGDFDVKLNSSDSLGSIANIQFQFTMKRV